MDNQSSFGGGKPPMSRYMGRADIDQMPETPQRGAHHRRAHSDILFRFTDDIVFDADVDFNLDTIDLSSMSEDNSAVNAGGAQMIVDSNKSNGEEKQKPVGPMGHFRSLSVDADFFEGLGFSAGGVDGGDGGKVTARHRHSNSMDGSSSSEVESVMNGVKKAMAPDKLAELALIDPKRAKRILANRQSAARSKERKIRYTSELERKVQTLQTEATTLSAQITLLQRDTTGLTSENKELKLRLQAMEQQAQLRDALNEALKEEVQHLKIATGQIPAVNGNHFNRGLPPQYAPHPQALHHFGGQQSPQQQQQAQQVLMAQSSQNPQSSNGPPRPSFASFNQKI
ncbi:Basic-leucine zipper domain [Dillenia turbinata]|uniref:Basic-leucine zipper domain n=1 Tax=Dillenia turbinata TaxID=194707 RepID=A0AAN8W1W9_9MAGN